MKGLLIPEWSIGRRGKYLSQHPYMSMGEGVLQWLACSAYNLEVVGSSQAAAIILLLCSWARQLALDSSSPPRSINGYEDLHPVPQIRTLVYVPVKWYTSKIVFVPWTWDLDEYRPRDEYPYAGTIVPNTSIWDYTYICPTSSSTVKVTGCYYIRWTEFNGRSGASIEHLDLYTHAGIYGINKL